MTLNEMIAALRRQLSDEQAVGWPDNAELLTYLDRAAGFLSEQLIALKDPSRLKRFRVLGTAPLPDDFTAFAGSVPIAVRGGTCEFYGDFPVDADYWGKLPPPSLQGEADEELPYSHNECVLIADIARIFALNKNEYDISQDMSLLSTLQTSMAAARKGQ
ncbi:MAG: hypothetical protein LBR71_06680 [Synergistaceae bacterium]|jgi:hypothetical protein|nr:hypothetical protein [Synergistaceae bacterium]